MFFTLPRTLGFQEKVPAEGGGVKGMSLIAQLSEGTAPPSSALYLEILHTLILGRNRVREFASNENELIKLKDHRFIYMPN